MPATDRPNYAAEQVRRHIEMLKGEGVTVIDRKAFHHDNLWLLLCDDKISRLHYLDIFRVNEGKTFTLHGIFLDLAAARAVFDRVRL